MTAGLALVAVLAGGWTSTAQEPAVAIEAAVVRARAALAGRQLVKANTEAEGAYHLAVAALSDARGSDAPRIRAALGDAIETRASIMVEDGARAEAVRFLRVEVESNRGSAIHSRLKAAVERVSLEGRPAPLVDGDAGPGAGIPGVDELKGKVVLLFFWAHWCGQCKGDGPMVEKLLAKYRRQGLAIVAPTQPYGYVENGRPASPDTEAQHIVNVRDTHYGFLRHEPVPIGEANFKAYGVTTIPMFVLLDRRGIVRLYHAGRMTEEELDAAIRKLL
jgi:thiol-disulfide isomerase/thioredoxin